MHGSSRAVCRQEAAMTAYAAQSETPTAQPESPVETSWSEVRSEAPSRHKSESEYTGVEAGDGESTRAQMPPLLDQLQKLGFTDRQMRTLARLSPETQEEVYLAVVTMLMSDDTVLEDILGWI